MLKCSPVTCSGVGRLFWNYRTGILGSFVQQLQLVPNWVAHQDSDNRMDEKETNQHGVKVQTRLKRYGGTWAVHEPVSMNLNVLKQHCKRYKRPIKSYTYLFCSRESIQPRRNVLFHVTVNRNWASAHLRMIAFLCIGYKGGIDVLPVVLIDLFSGFPREERHTEGSGGHDWMTDKKSEKRKGGDIGGNWRKGS